MVLAAISAPNRLHARNGRAHDQFISHIQYKGESVMTGPMKRSSPANNQTIDWPTAAEMWRRGYDTKSIASFFWVHESIIYNNLHRIKAEPTAYAGAA